MRGLPIIVGVLAVVLTLPASAGPQCDRVVSVGDLHGGVDVFLTILGEAGLIDSERRWAGGESCLVQLGDIVDRGPRSAELLDYLIDLRNQAPAHVFVLLGNHEMMNILGDLRYVAPEEFAAFASAETESERATGYTAFLQTPLARWTPAERRRAAFDRLYPPGWFAHRRAFEPDGRYGKWLLEREMLLKIDGSVYVHGGLSPGDARRGIPALNATVARDVANYFALRERLIEGGVIGPLTSQAAALGIVAAWHDVGDQGLARAAREFIGLTQSPILRADGPLWNRDLATADERSFTPLLDEVLAATEAERIVVAHTTTLDGKIASRFAGRVFVVDTGAGPAYPGRPAALEISRDGRIRAVYPGESVQFVAPSRDE